MQQTIRQQRACRRSLQESGCGRGTAWWSGALPSVILVCALTFGVVSCGPTEPAPATQRDAPTAPRDASAASNAPVVTASPAAFGDGAAAVGAGAVSRPGADAAPREQVRVPSAAGAPDFDGVRAVCATADGLVLAWDAAEDDVDPPSALRYQIFLADEAGDQDFTRPYLTTASGVLRAQVAGLPVGRAVYVVVRAIDRAGNHDGNDFEWCATPRPVVYVDGAAPKGGDGRAAATPLASLEMAVAATIDRDGVNIHVAAGTYEAQLFVFEGVHVYGGFGRDFSLETWPSAPTTLRASTAADLVVIAPGESPCGLFQLTLDGADKARRGIVGDDCVLHLGGVTVRRFVSKGVELRSEDDPDAILAASLRHCRIVGNHGEGMAAVGTLDVAMSHVDISGNREEGLEIEPLRSSRASKARVKIERCSIRDNGDLGADIQLAPAAAPGKVRVTFRQCVLARNGDHGISLDIPEGIADDVRVKFEDNLLTGNASSGIQLECDSNIELFMARNQWQDNGAAALALGGAAGTVLPVVTTSRCAGITRARFVPSQSGGQAGIELVLADGIVTKARRVIAVADGTTAARDCSVKVQPAQTLISWQAADDEALTAVELSGSRGDGRDWTVTLRYPLLRKE